MSCLAGLVGFGACMLLLPGLVCLCCCLLVVCDLVFLCWLFDLLGIVDDFSGLLADCVWLLMPLCGFVRVCFVFVCVGMFFWWFGWINSVVVSLV